MIPICITCNKQIQDDLWEDFYGNPGEHSSSTGFLHLGFVESRKWPDAVTIMVKGLMNLFIRFAFVNWHQFKKQTICGS
jgi:hypothetical protein